MYCVLLCMDGTSVGRESRRKPGALEAGYNRRCEQTRVSCLQETKICRGFFFWVFLEVTKAAKRIESSLVFSNQGQIYPRTVSS